MEELGLKPQEAVVLLNIIEKCWKQGQKAWPSVDYIAKNIGRRNSATREILKNLTEKGFITKEQRFNTTNLYGLEPTAEKLAIHMRGCRHTARKPEGYRQKSSSRDSQNTSDYLEEELNRKNNIDANAESEIQLVYDCYINHFEKNSELCKLTSKRMTTIKARLNECGQEMLLKAIENTAYTSFYRGTNDRNWEASLDYVIDSYERVEQLANLSEIPKTSREIKDNKRGREWRESMRANEAKLAGEQEAELQLN